MRVAVIGGGLSGAAIVRAARDRGCEVSQHSRVTGFDVLGSSDDAGDGSALRAVEGADVIVEATGSFTTSRRRVTDFFTRSTRTVSDLATRLGARHVLLSIAQCTRPELQGYGYFAGKTAQEALAATLSPRLTIVRSTQWFEFAAQNLQRMQAGPVALVPGMTIAPVALDAVATVVARAAAGDRSASRTGPGPVAGAEIVEVAGPEVTTLWDMTSALPRSRALPLPVPLPIPGRMGRAFRGGALLPGDGAEVVGPRFAEWLATRR